MTDGDARMDVSLPPLEEVVKWQEQLFQWGGQLAQLEGELLVMAKQDSPADPLAIAHRVVLVEQELRTIVDNLKPSFAWVPAEEQKRWLRNAAQKARRERKIDSS